MKSLSSELVLPKREREREREREATLKILGAVVYMCNHNTQEAKAGRLEFETSSDYMRPYPPKKNRVKRFFLLWNNLH
jgi:hypothetical protein